MKVFLDVGAHRGQTLSVVKRWDFDRIECFEPAAVNYEKLSCHADARTTIHEFGLWSETTEKKIYNPGYPGCALWPRADRPNEAETVKFVQASEWLHNNLRDGDVVWLKLNIEGAELDVITDLLDTGALDLHVSFLLVMWDAHKIPQLKPRLESVRARLEKEYPPPRALSSKELRFPNHAERIAGWLKLTGGVSRR